MRTLPWHHPLGDLFRPLLPSLSFSLYHHRPPPLRINAPNANQTSDILSHLGPSVASAHGSAFEALLLTVHPCASIGNADYTALMPEKGGRGGVGTGVGDTALNVRRARQAAGEMKKKVVKYQRDGEKKQLSVSLVFLSLYRRHDSCFPPDTSFCKAVCLGWGPT